jgi:hypothetical protein
LLLILGKGIQFSPLSMILAFHHCLNVACSHL